MKNIQTIIAMLFLLISLYSCNNEQNDYYKAKQANTIESLKEFAINYPNSVYTDSVKEIIDSIIWHTVLNADSLNQYENFIDEHPKSKFIKGAKEIFDSLMWQEVKQNNTIDDYETFIDDYPDSKFIDSAKIMIEK